MEIYLGLITEKLPAYRQRNKIGDCLAYRQQKWGMYDDIAEETGMAMNTLREYKHISEAVKSDVRTSDLSFNHHKEVASLPPEWLDTFYPHGATLKRGSEVPKENLGKMPVTKKESHLLQWLSKNKGF